MTCRSLSKSTQCHLAWITNPEIFPKAPLCHAACSVGRASDNARGVQPEGGCSARQLRSRLVFHCVLRNACCRNEPIPKCHATSGMTWPLARSSVVRNSRLRGSRQAPHAQYCMHIRSDTQVMSWPLFSLPHAACAATGAVRSGLRVCTSSRAPGSCRRCPPPPPDLGAPSGGGAVSPWRTAQGRPRRRGALSRRATAAACLCESAPEPGPPCEVEESQQTSG